MGDRNKDIRRKQTSSSSNSLNNSYKKVSSKPKKRRKSQKGKIIGVFLGFLVAVGLVVFALVKFNFIDLDILNGIFNKGHDLSKEVYCKEVSEENVKYDEGILYVDNQVSLIANEGVKKREIKKLAKQYDAEIVGYIEFTGDYQLEFSEEKSYDKLNSIVSELEADPNVESASLYRVTQMTSSSQEGVTNTDGGTTSFYPNDPWDGSDWDKINPDGKNWGAEAIHATEAWSLKDEMDYVNIGILDPSTFDTKHEDLIFTKVWNSKDTNEDSGHGTVVAGIIGSVFGNKKGISGICPKSTLYASDMSGYSYAGEMGVKCGLARLILNNVKVINCSFGHDDLIIASSLIDQNIIKDERAIKNVQSQLDYYKEVYTNFLNKFINEGYDFLIVKAAGNENDDYYKIVECSSKYKYGIEIRKNYEDGFTRCNNIDSKYDYFQNITDKNIKNKIIVVGSCKLDYFKAENYTLSDFSNKCDRVDVIAPGEDIYSTFPDNNYGTGEGTSISAPHVSGLAGMIWGINKDLSAEQVKQIIAKTANIDVSNTDKKMINARMAVELAKRIKGEGVDSLSEKGAFLCSVADAYEYETSDKSDAEKEQNAGDNALLEGVKITLKDKEGNDIDTLNSNIVGEGSVLVDQGTYDIVFEKEGYQSSILRDIEIRSNDVVYKKVLLRKISTVTGKVVNKNGSSLEGVTVKFKNSDENKSVETDSNGNFSKELKHGTYTLVISKKGYETREMTVEVNGTQKDLGEIVLNKEQLISYKNYLGEWYAGGFIYKSENPNATWEWQGEAYTLIINSISSNNIDFGLDRTSGHAPASIKGSFAEDIKIISMNNGKVIFTFKDNYTYHNTNKISHGTILLKNNRIYFTSEDGGFLSGSNVKFTREEIDYPK